MLPVGVWGASDNLPDLRIASFSLGPTSITPGKTLTISVTVKNNGARQAWSAHVTLFASKAASTLTDTGPVTLNAGVLAPGASGTVVFSFTVPPVAPGQYKVYAKVDPDRLVAESNEGNNRSSALSVTVLTSPIPPPPQNTTHWVAGGGSDANDGSAARPWRTIQRALDQAQPGETVFVQPGVYGPAAFVRSGTPSALITLRGQSGAIIAGDGTGDGLQVWNVHDIVIEGLEVTNFEVGISLSEAAHLTLRDNVLRSNTAVGIQAWIVTDSTFESNQFLDPGPPYPQLADAVQDYGLNFYYSERLTVTYNAFFGKHNQALSFKRRAGQAYVAHNTFDGCMYTCLYLGQNDDDTEGDMTSFDITAEANTFRDAVDSVTGTAYRLSRAIGIRNVRNALVRDNTITNALMSPPIETIPSPNTAGLAPGANQIYGNTTE
jgi:hypothetical protein